MARDVAAPSMPGMSRSMKIISRGMRRARTRSFLAVLGGRDFTADGGEHSAQNFAIFPAVIHDQSSHMATRFQARAANHPRHNFLFVFGGRQRDLKIETRTRAALRLQFKFSAQQFNLAPRDGQARDRCRLGGRRSCLGGTD